MLGPSLCVHVSAHQGSCGAMQGWTKALVWKAKALKSRQCLLKKEHHCRCRLCLFETIRHILCCKLGSYRRLTVSIGKQENGLHLYSRATPHHVAEAAGAFDAPYFQTWGLQVVQQRRSSRAGRHVGEQRCFVYVRPDFWWPKLQYLLLHGCKFLCAAHGSLH